MHQPVEAPSNVRFVRMNTGEDLITEITKHNEHYVFTNPLKVIYNMGPTRDSVLLAFSPWILSTICEKQEFPIFPSDVITVVKPTDEIISCYHKFISRLEKAREAPTIIREREEINDDLGELIGEEELEQLKTALEAIERNPTKRRLH